MLHVAVEAQQPTMIVTWAVIERCVMRYMRDGFKEAAGVRNFHFSFFRFTLFSYSRSYIRLLRNVLPALSDWVCEYDIWANGFLVGFLSRAEYSMIVISGGISFGGTHKLLSSKFITNHARGNGHRCSLLSPCMRQMCYMCRSHCILPTASRSYTKWTTNP